eukprot:UN00018
MKTSLLLCVMLILALTINTIRADDVALGRRFRSLFTSTEAEIAADPKLSELAASVCSFDVINLKSLKGQVKDVVDPFDADHYQYTMTFCATSSEAKCAADKGSICQYDQTQPASERYTAALASFTNTPAPEATYIQPGNKNSGVSIRFKNGGICHLPGGVQIDRQVDLRIKCPTSGSDSKITISETSTCVYEIDMFHKSACAGASDDEGMSGGAIFLLIIFITLAIYFAAGFAICMFRFGKRGIDAVPHKDFWCSLPGWYVAGIKFTIGKIKNAAGSKTITTSAGEYEEAY